MTAEPRRLHLGELLLDLAIVIGSALYVHAAGAYPAQGRQIPLVVGWLAIALGAVHLVGHAVPALWAVTHDSEARGRTARNKARDAVAERLARTDAPESEAESDAAESAVTDSALTDSALTESAAPEDEGADREPAMPKSSPGDPRQVVYAIAWAVGLLAGVYLVGFAVALPVFFLAYFGVLRAWRTAVIGAVVMWALTEGLFVYALSVPLPQGLLW